MYEVTSTGVSGSVITVTASCEGEMLDRVRLAMESPFIATVSVTRTIENLLNPISA